MPNEFAPNFDDPAFDLDAWYRRSPDEIRQAKEAAAYQAWRDLSPVGMEDAEGADWEARNAPVAADAGAAGVDAAAKAPRPLPNVGPGAKTLLDKIGGAEVPRAKEKGDPTGYDTQFGYGDLDPQLPKKPTTMTLNEVDAHQSAMQRAGHSSALGRYQIQRPSLLDLRTRYRLDGSSVFTPQLQDQLARTVMREVGYDEYCKGRRPFEKVHAGFIGRWASLPDANGVSGHLNDRTGEPQNAGMTPDEFRTALDQACRIDLAHPDAF